VIVRSVRSGLPVNEGLRIVARETPDPVGAEFTRLIDSLTMGVALDQALKKMHDSMPTAEVGFFSIVMTIQSKSGGNLSEALANLAGVLRDRKRLEGKIKAMSSEAKASAGIIGSLPPVVMGIVWLTTPGYISLLFTERLGNLMLFGCGVWMGTGIMVMRKMINFKH
jgi:tight adherence protein B